MYFKSASFSPEKIFAFFVCALSCSLLFAQMPTNGLDVKHYDFSIVLNDSTNRIEGKAVITTGFTKSVKDIRFDLVKKNTDGIGMNVTAVTKNNTALKFVQDSQRVVIDDAGLPDTENTYSITYEGIPADGLIISNTKYGERSFFADNWPNRAHNWIPCNDHLSDKATVEFKVTAPNHYQVISNGRKIEETDLHGNIRFTHWSEAAPLPTKVMVIGVTRFAVQHIGGKDGIPVSSWVYPDDRDSGFAQYAMGADILQWYIDHVGPYGFEKLANVQSKTMFGGMENAGCIFYFENSVNSKDLEALFAHEIAHQWFGDNATEKDWPHLWLSEGFATYMTDLYFENKYGTDTLKSRLRQQRTKVLAFYEKHKTPVVDTTRSANLMQLLNANSYQKGGWVLHMLRESIGDSLFWKGVRTYYDTYRGGNASTRDLQHVFEDVSHQNLSTFFQQWLYTSGQPELNIQWKYDRRRKKVWIHIEQRQDTLFEFPLEISFAAGAKNQFETISIKDKVTKLEFPIAFMPEKVEIDPDVNLLFQLKDLNHKTE